MLVFVKGKGEPLCALFSTVREGVSSMNQQNPAQLEQQQLAALEERFQWSKSQLENGFPTNRLATLEEIQHAVDYTQQLAVWFSTHYGPTANSLQVAGFPGLAHRLNAIVADLQQAHGLYMQMYQERTKPAPPTTYTPPVLISNPSGAVLPGSSDQAYADASETCVHCQYYLGDMYWNLKICPKCQLLLRPLTS
jgi:hypothetical protein